MTSNILAAKLADEVVIGDQIMYGTELATVRERDREGGMIRLVLKQRYKREVVRVEPSEVLHVREWL